MEADSKARDFIDNQDGHSPMFMANIVKESPRPPYNPMQHSRAHQQQHAYSFNQNAATTNQPSQG